MQDGIMRLFANHAHGLWVWAPSAPFVAGLKAVETQPFFHQLLSPVIYIHRCQLGALNHEVVATTSCADWLSFGWRDFWVGRLAISLLASWLGRSVGL